MATFYWPAAGFSTRWPAAATAATPPAGANIWVNGQNLDTTNNSSLTDTQALGTVKNLGSFGATADFSQATAGNKPRFRTSFLNGKGGIECVDASRSMLSGVFTQFAQPFTIGFVWKSDKTTLQIVADFRATIDQCYTAAGGTLHGSCGSDVSSGLTPSANQFHTAVFRCNGASSEIRLDGVSSGTVNMGANASGTTVTILHDNGGTFGLIGGLAEFLVWPSDVAGATIESYFAANWGVSFPF